MHLRAHGSYSISVRRETCRAAGASETTGAADHRFRGAKLHSERRRHGGAEARRAEQVTIGRVGKFEQRLQSARGSAYSLEGELVGAGCRTLSW
jgi:hypothetical protein